MKIAAILLAAALFAAGCASGAGSAMRGLHAPDNSALLMLSAPPRES